MVVLVAVRGGGGTITTTTATTTTNSKQRTTTTRHQQQEEAKVRRTVRDEKTGGQLISALLPSLAAPDVKVGMLPMFAAAGAHSDGGGHDDAAAGTASSSAAGGGKLALAAVAALQQSVAVAASVSMGTIVNVGALTANLTETAERAEASRERKETRRCVALCAYVRTCLILSFRGVSTARLHRCRARSPCADPNRLFAFLPSVFVSLRYGRDRIDVAWQLATEMAEQRAKENLTALARQSRAAARAARKAGVNSSTGNGTGSAIDPFAYPTPEDAQLFEWFEAGGGRLNLVDVRPQGRFRQHRALVADEDLNAGDEVLAVPFKLTLNRITMQNVGLGCKVRRVRGGGCAPACMHVGG